MRYGGANSEGIIIGLLVDFLAAMVTFMAWFIAGATWAGVEVVRLLRRLR